MSAPSLFLHGFAGGPETFSALTDDLDEPWLAPHLSGHGNLSDDHWARDFEEEIARVARMVRDEFAGRQVRVVGYSLGARIGLGLTVRHPDLVSQATLVGVHPGLRNESERSERRDRDHQFVEILETEGIDSFVARWELQPIFASQARLDPKTAERQRRLRRGHAARGLAHAMRTLGLAEMPDFWPFLSVVDRPVTLVVGAEDQKFERLAREMAALLPHASVVVAPGSGHNVVLEAPHVISGVLAKRMEFS